MPAYSNGNRVYVIPVFHSERITIEDVSSVRANPTTRGIGDLWQEMGKELFEFLHNEVPSGFWAGFTESYRRNYA